eukprot:4082792-Pyramimonas_sp.AAC.1
MEQLSWPDGNSISQPQADPAVFRLPLRHPGPRRQPVHPRQHLAQPPSGIPQALLGRQAVSRSS